MLQLPNSNQNLAQCWMLNETFAHLSLLQIMKSVTNFFSIHPSSHLFLLPCSRGSGVSGLYPSCYEVKAGLQPVQAASSSQGHFEMYLMLLVFDFPLGGNSSASLHKAASGNIYKLTINCSNFSHLLKVSSPVWGRSHCYYIVNVTLRKV